MSLFVPEEEPQDVAMLSDTESALSADLEDVDDPVVEEIPIFLNKAPLETQRLMILQYVTQLAKKPMTVDRGIHIGSARLKTGAKMLEIDVPLETSSCFDEAKATNWGSMDHETLGGTVHETSENFVMCVKRNATTDKEIVLTRISETAQLRPVFHHIDALNEAEKKQRDSENAQERGTTKSNVMQVVQRTAKAAGSENEIRYSDAISSFKKNTDEPFLNAEWYDRASEQCKGARVQLYGSETMRKTQLSVLESRETYLDSLLEEA